MKTVAAAFVIIVACFVMVRGQEKKAAENPPFHWELTLNTGGAPWEKKFQINLNQDGTLAVLEEDPAKKPGDTKSKLTVKLSDKDAQEIYGQTLKAFREFRFTQYKVERHDGTNLTLRLTANGRSLEMQFLHIAQIEEESVEAAKVLSLLNKHLPKERQIY